MPLAPGEVFAGFTIDRELGSGGMGEVYLARHPRLPRMVALKLLRTDLGQDPSFVGRFQREAQTVAALDHPNIVPVDDCGADHGQLWLSMRFIDGTTADRALAGYQGGMEPSRAVRIVEKVASALDFAHRANIIHRDVKPANILLGRPGDDDERERVYLSDFGVAKAMGEMEAHATSYTMAGGVIATLDYAAPEQIEGHALDGRCDIYALGCVLYKLLTGVVPFPGENLAAKIYAHLHKPTPVPSAMDPRLAVFDPIVQRALARDPGQRYQSGRELTADTRRALGLPSTSATGIGPVTGAAAGAVAGAVAGAAISGYTGPQISHTSGSFSVPPSGPHTGGGPYGSPMGPGTGGSYGSQPPYGPSGQGGSGQGGPPGPGGYGPSGPSGPYGPPGGSPPPPPGGYGPPSGPQGPDPFASMPTSMVRAGDAQSVPPGGRPPQPGMPTSLDRLMAAPPSTGMSDTTKRTLIIGGALVLVAAIIVGAVLLSRGKGGSSTAASSTGDGDHNVSNVSQSFGSNAVEIGKLIVQLREAVKSDSSEHAELAIELVDSVHREASSAAPNKQKMLKLLGQIGSWVAVASPFVDAISKLLT